MQSRNTFFDFSRGIDMDRKNLWVKTPLIHSGQMSVRLGCDVYLKLEVCLSTHFQLSGLG